MHDRAVMMQAVPSSLGKTLGVAICTVASDQAYPRLCTDGAGGAILTWVDGWVNGRGTSDIHAQKVDRFGYLGDVAPQIATVEDVMNDQGGR